MEKMSNYFLLAWNDKPPLASALEPPDAPQTYELISALEGKHELPFDLHLVKMSKGKKGIEKSEDLSGLDTVWLDYQPNGMVWPLMSEKMRSVVEQHLTGKEGIDWINATIQGNGEKRIYYILRFNQPLDVLDEEQTMFVAGTNRIIKPCFSLSKINGFALFPKPAVSNSWKISPAIYVNETLKKAMQKEKLTGIVFEKTLVS
jgi:hypothetical protein